MQMETRIKELKDFDTKGKIFNLQHTRFFFLGFIIAAIIALILSFCFSVNAERIRNFNLRQGRLSSYAGVSDTGAFCVYYRNLDSTANCTGGSSDAYAVVTAASASNGTLGFKNATQATSNFGVTISTSNYNKSTWVAVAGIAYIELTTKNSTIPIGNWLYVTGDGTVSGSATKSYNSTLIGIAIDNSTAIPYSRVKALLLH